MKNVIYYFTGTGNSLAAARQIASRVGDCEIESIAERVAKMNEGGASAIGTDASAERIGFAFPVYYYGLPSIVNGFFASLRVSGNPYLFCVATRGGSSGYGAFAQVSGHLKKRGNRLDAGFSVLMPENYPVLYNPTDLDASKRMLEEAAKEIDGIAKSVAAKRPFREGWQNPLAAALVSKPVNAWFARSIRASYKKFSVSPVCVSCGKCAVACGVRNISLEGGKPVWHDHCEQCYGCYNVCPVHAIDFGKVTQGKRQYLHPILKG